MNKKGFTLIEVLLVMAILGILVTIVVIAINPGQILKKTRDTRRKQDVVRIAEIMELYYAENGEYPRESALDSSIGFSDDCNHGGDDYSELHTGHPDCAGFSPGSGWDPASPAIQDALAPWIKSLPVDPINDVNWHYWYEPEPTPPEANCDYDPGTPLGDCSNIRCGNSGQPSCQKYTIANHVEMVSSVSSGCGGLTDNDPYKRCSWGCGSTGGRFDKNDCAGFSFKLSTPL